MRRASLNAALCLNQVMSAQLSAKAMSLTRSLTSSSRSLPQLWHTLSSSFLIFARNPTSNQHLRRRVAREASLTNVKDWHSKLYVAKMTGADIANLSACATSKEALSGAKFRVIQAFFTRLSACVVLKER